MTSGVAKAGPRFTPLIETNDHEGETWTWWIQIDGNQDVLDAIQEVIREALGESEYFEEFSLPEWPYGEKLGEDQVNLLERWSDEGYHRSHNKVSGHLVVPDWWFETISAFDRLEALYKGGIDRWERAE
jgi:hypothetical protein